MNTQMLSRARHLFQHTDVPASTARHNMRQWVRSIRMLGDRWLLARPMNGGATNGCRAKPMMRQILTER